MYNLYLTADQGFTADVAYGAQRVVEANEKHVENIGRSDNPMDWLFLDPNGAKPDFNFGVLRQTFSGHRNTAFEFGLRKLHPGLSLTQIVKADGFTCYRSGTVLPPDAPDSLDDPLELLKHIDASVCDQVSSLLVCLTLKFPSESRLHHGWEIARDFAMKRLCLPPERRLPVVIVQHRPGAVGSDNPNHVHLLAGCRRLTTTGFAGCVRDLACDRGQTLLFNEWRDHRQNLGLTSQ